jgi:hypothetical protein
MHIAAPLSFGAAVSILLLTLKQLDVKPRHRYHV